MRLLAWLTCILNVFSCVARPEDVRLFLLGSPAPLLNMYEDESGGNRCVNKRFYPPIPLILTSSSSWPQSLRTSILVSHATTLFLLCLPRFLLPNKQVRGRRRRGPGRRLDGLMASPFADARRRTSGLVCHAERAGSTSLAGPDVSQPLARAESTRTRWRRTLTPSSVDLRGESFEKMVFMATVGAAPPSIASPPARK